MTAREINARFGTVCKQCGGHIPKGTRVLWAAGEGVRHLAGECVAGGTQQAPPAALEVPAGRYAVGNDGGELRFYRVWRGTRNKSVVRVYVLHGPDEDRVPGRLAELGVLSKIDAAGPREAAIRYGREIGECSSCGLRLTNALSRELGIGPVCGGRFYADKADWTAVKKQARTDLRARGIDPEADLPDDVPARSHEYPLPAAPELEPAQAAGPPVTRPRPGKRAPAKTEAERAALYGDEAPY